MIFCTTGTTRFPFNRLINAVRQACSDKKEPLIIQGLEKEIPYKDIVRHMTEARVVICHGGAGTILLATQFSKVKPFVLPRLARFGEHVDDHQLYFATYMRKKGLIVVPQNKNKPLEELRSYLQAPLVYTKKPVSENKNLIKRLEMFTRT